MLSLRKKQIVLHVLLILHTLCIIEASKLNRFPLSKAGRNKVKSIWDKGLSSGDEIEKQTGLSVGSIAEHIETNLGVGFSNSPSVTPTLTPTPSPTPSSSSSPSASPTPTISPAPSPSNEPSRSPSKSPSPTPFRNSKQSPSPTSTIGTVTFSTDIFEVPTDGSEVENEVDMDEISEFDDALEPAEIGEKVTIGDFLIDGDLDDVQLTSRQLFSGTVLNRTTIRKTLRVTNFYLIVNGQVIRMRVRVKCKGTLQPIENSIRIEEKLVRLKNGGTGLKAVYRLTGPSGNRCKVKFLFKITRRKKLKPTASKSFIALPTISPMPQFISASPSETPSRENSSSPEPSEYSSQTPSKSPGYSTSATPSVSSSTSTSFSPISTTISLTPSASVSTSATASISSSVSAAMSSSISPTPSSSVSISVVASISSSASPAISTSISPTPTASAAVPASSSPSYSASSLMTPVPSGAEFNWQESSDAIWAMGCDFIGNDLERIIVQGYQCSGACGGRSGCTHFVWTQFDGGSCYLKGPTTRSAYEAVANLSPGSVCGILKWAIPPSPPDPAGRASDNWVLVLEDNFDTLNDALWSYETEDTLGGWGNHEIQTYTTNNAFVLDGNLNVQLRKEANGEWTSSRLRTKDKFEFTFGRVDTRLRTERRNGVWPAVWALSDKCIWPLCGEIDLFEMQTAWNFIPSSLHFQSNHAGNAMSFRNPDTDTADWRIYSMEWTPSYIAFFHDDHEIGRYNKPLDSTQVNWPFTSDNSFYLIINNAMYPQLWGTPPDSDLTQHTLHVDYIKVWAYSSAR